MSRLLLVLLSLFMLSACQAEATETLTFTEEESTDPILPSVEPEDQILLPTEVNDPDNPLATPIEPVAPDFILEDDYEIVTLLPFDAIPAIDDPQYYNIEEADQEYDPDELVIGISFNGEARAYSVPLLSRHEIVNDTVGGVKLSVTW